MEIELHQIDAFTDRVFAGNPAAVCPLDSWPEDDVLAAMPDPPSAAAAAAQAPQPSLQPQPSLLQPQPAAAPPSGASSSAAPAPAAASSEWDEACLPDDVLFALLDKR